MKIISGGQTGADRGALDAAIESGVAHGGWCPSGRRAEDGRIPDRYDLTETDSTEYPVRTERNVTDSDATLILCRGRPSGGTELTVRLAERHARPCLISNPDQPSAVAKVRSWLSRQGVEVLNVAGPRESQCPGIADSVKKFVSAVIASPVA